jgi:hypothetical protein
VTAAVAAPAAMHVPMRMRRPALNIVVTPDWARP